MKLLEFYSESEGWKAAASVPTSASPSPDPYVHYLLIPGQYSLQIGPSSGLSSRSFAESVAITCKSSLPPAEDEIDFQSGSLVVQLNFPEGSLPWKAPFGTLDCELLILLCLLPRISFNRMGETLLHRIYRLGLRPGSNRMPPTPFPISVRLWLSSSALACYGSPTYQTSRLPLLGVHPLGSMGTSEVMITRKVASASNLSSSSRQPRFSHSS